MGLETNLLLHHIQGSYSKGTLCDPIDGSPPGSAVPRTLQARSEVGGAVERRDPVSEARGGNERSYPASEVRGGRQEELPHAPTPEARGDGWEEQPTPEARCLENPMGRGAWQAMFHWVAKN